MKQYGGRLYAVLRDNKNKNIPVVEGAVSVGGCSFFDTAFHALRQPVLKTVRRRAFLFFERSESV